MLKQELITKMVEFGSQSKVEAERNLIAIEKVLEYCAENKEILKLSGYFTMEVKESAERNGRNPATKESIVIPATKRPKFSAGKILKDLAKKSI